jgi:integrase
LTDSQIDELWDALYLTADELPAFLDLVRLAARHAWIYPMCCMAAHTSARRSEMINGLLQDVDFEEGAVTIREKKRVRGRQTTRRVPLSPFLDAVLREWLDGHPGGNHLFCRGAGIARSRTRRESGSKLTRNEAHDHLQRTLAGSKWSVVRGYHVLRHSFISACASKGVDQRLIQEWCGHMSEEMSARYRHLYPSVQKQVMASVFC